MRSFLASILLTFSGCLMPPDHEIFRSGRVVKKAEGSFLNYSDVNKSEVLKTLGLPTWKNEPGDLFVYKWRQDSRWYSEIAVPVGETGGTLAEVNWRESAQNYGLFIQFDAAEMVIRHEVWSFAPDLAIEEASRLWLNRTNASPKPK
jgi:hypothetical protein